MVKGGTIRVAGTPAHAFSCCWRRCSRRFRECARAVERATLWRTWNPGEYGARWHDVFLATYPIVRHPIVVFGLNPGPYGMAQTGIPFTDVLRIKTALPELCRRLSAAGETIEVPGLAPLSLRPFLRRTFEASAVRVYRFLETCFGNAQKGVREVVVANPCPLLFIDPNDGANRTPADLVRAVHARGGDGRRLRDELDRLRTENCADTLETLEPSAVILLGKDVQKALSSFIKGRCARRGLVDRVIDFEHPARAVPKVWADRLTAEIRRRGL